MKLHFGCGRNKLKGYLNCDLSSKVKPDRVLDITKELPFEDNSVEEIVINHTLEHLENIFEVLSEFYRICEDKAIIKIRVPYFSHESAFSTMTHVRFFTYTSFDFLDKNHLCHYDSINGDFKVINKRLHWRKCFFFFESLFNLFPRVYQELFCWWFPAKELYVELEVRK